MNELKILKDASRIIKLINKRLGSESLSRLEVEDYRFCIIYTLRAKEPVKDKVQVRFDSGFDNKDNRISCLTLAVEQNHKKIFSKSVDCNGKLPKSLIEDTIDLAIKINTVFITSSDHLSCGLENVEEIFNAWEEELQS